MAPLEEINQRIVEEVRTEQARRAQDIAEQEARAQQALFDGLSSDFEREFPEEILALLPERRYEMRFFGTEEKRPMLLMEYAGISWRIFRDRRQVAGIWIWKVSAQALGHSIQGSPQRGDLRGFLLYHFGVEQENLLKRRAEDAAYEARQAEQRAARSREEAEEKRQAALRLAEAEATHQRLQAQWEAMREQAEKDLWRWPKDKAVTFYGLSYQTGFGFDEGELRIEHAEGYTTMADLQEGWAQLMPTRDSWGSLKPALRLKLDAAYHLPIWRELTYAFMEQLPEELTQWVKLVFPDVCLSCYDAEDRLYPDQKRRFRPASPDESHSENIGVVPLAWIRALVDARRS